MPVRVGVRTERSPAGCNKPRVFILIQSGIIYTTDPPPHGGLYARSCLRFVVFRQDPVRKPGPIEPVGLLAVELTASRAI